MKPPEGFPKEYIDPYYELVNKIKPLIGLKTKIEVGIVNGWLFEIDHKDKFVINGPPYFPEFVPPFVHYLVHAKMLEDGWPSPEMDYEFTVKAFETSLLTKEEFDQKTEEEKEQIYFGLQNRPTDSFFDFYVWLFVCKNIDQKYFLDFTAETPTQTNEEVIKGFEKLYQKRGFKLHNKVMCIDWFAMFYSVSTIIAPQRAEELNELYKRLFTDDKFLELVPADTKETIDWLRNFYSELYKKHPDYKSLIKNNFMEKEFTAYFNYLWKNSGFNVKIKEFVKIKKI